MSDFPGAAKTLIKKLDGWQVKTTEASGQLAFGGLSEDTDGGGKRHRVTALEDVDSVLVRACHLDGRHIVALYVRRAGLVMPETEKVKKVRPLLLALAASDLLDDNGAALIGLVAVLTLWSRKGWALDMAWRGRHADDFTPKRITATELTAYVTTPGYLMGVAA